MDNGQTATANQTHSPPECPSGTVPEEDRSAVQMVVAQHFIGALTANMISLGDRLGVYAALKKHGPCTSAQLAKGLGMSERYIREWLYQQASAKVITCDADASTFWLTPAQQDVLVHEHGEEASPHFFLGMANALPGLSKVAAEKLPNCFKTGEGISYDGYDEGITCGVCRELGVWARHCLVDSLNRMPEVKEKLEKGCMVADVGCGCGEAVLAVAKAFPNSTFHGYDISEKALRHARGHTAEAGLTNVTWCNPGVEEEGMPASPTYDLVMTHDAIHDMARPDLVVPHVLHAMKPDACWIIGDMSTLESQAANVHSHPLAPLLYGFSCHLCLPSGLSTPDGLGLGTTGLPTHAMETLLKEAGFKSMDVLDWEHPLNRYYLARP